MSVQSFKPTVYHALVVIFLEFFAWGLLTTPTINVSANMDLIYHSVGSLTSSNLILTISDHSCHISTAYFSL